MPTAYTTGGAHYKILHEEISAWRRPVAVPKGPGSPCARIARHAQFVWTRSSTSWMIWTRLCLSLLQTAVRLNISSMNMIQGLMNRSRVSRRVPAPMVQEPRKHLSGHRETTRRLPRLFSTSKRSANRVSDMSTRVFSDRRRQVRHQAAVHQLGRAGWVVHGWL